VFRGEENERGAKHPGWKSAYHVAPPARHLQGGLAARHPGAASDPGPGQRGPGPVGGKAGSAKGEEGRCYRRGCPNTTCNHLHARTHTRTYAHKLLPTTYVYTFKISTMSTAFQNSYTLMHKSALSHRHTHTHTIQTQAVTHIRTERFTHISTHTHTHTHTHT